MPKSSLPALVFNGVSLSIIRQNNQTYFSASDIAKSLGYQSDDSISRIYRRNADEFTSDMSQTVNLTVSGNYQKTVRLFSLRGAHLVAMFSRTPIAKEFRKWVLDVLDRETSQKAVCTLPAVRVITTEEQTAINMRAHVLAQEKYREIRGELMSDYLSGKVDDLDIWIPQETKSMSSVDIAEMMREGLPVSSVDIPKSLADDIEKKAWEMAREFYDLSIDHLRRAVAYRCVAGGRLNLKYAKKVVRTTTLGNVLLHKLRSDINRVEGLLEFAKNKVENALKRIQEGRQ